MEVIEVVLISALLTAPAFPVAAQSSVPFADPGPADRAAIDAGRSVVREERVPESAWPRVTIQQFIDATPREAAAVFVDYERHASYLPGLERSVISRRLNSRIVEVDYILAVPIFADEEYTVRDSVSFDGAGGYRVDWVKVRARSTKQIVGYARFQPYRNPRTGVAGTLLTYVNLVVPGQRLAGPLRGRALKQVRETVAALVKQVEAERTTQRELLAAQIAALDAALQPSPVVPPSSAR